MPAPHMHRGGYRFRKEKARMFALYGDTCIHCGHDGARQADHLTPLAVDPDQPVQAELMRPAHGGAQQGFDNPCPTCSRRCNQERGSKLDFAMFKPRMTW